MSFIGQRRARRPHQAGTNGSTRYLVAVAKEPTDPHLEDLN